jgi:Arm DNA-binding domain/Phage integrase family
MAKRLTEQAVERLAVRRQAYTIWDATTVGLGVKVTPRGRRIWVAQLKYPGHKVQTRRTLGHCPALGLADARRKAEQWYALSKDGIDPSQATEEERRKAEAARHAEALKRENTFASVVERYLAERSANRRVKRDRVEIQRMLIRHWGDRPIGTITPRDVRKLFDALKVRAPYEARNGWAHAVGIFRYGVHAELLEVSPCASLDHRLLFKGAPIPHRQRVLDDTELFALWRATGRCRYPWQPFYRMLMLTATRTEELADAAWSEFHPALRRLIRDAARAGEPVNWTAVDNSIKLWTIPRERFKSDAEHVVPLPDVACAILEGLPRFRCDYLFTVNGRAPVYVNSKIKQRLDGRMLRTLRALARQRGDDPQAVLPRWVNHDLRRTVRTNLSALGVDDHVAEMVLGHGRRGLQRIYDQHRYVDEIRDALERWAGKLRSIVEPTSPAPPAKVVALTARRKARR